MHGIHCIQSGWFWPCCIKSTALVRDALGLTAWTPLHTIGIHCATMHGILCIQSLCMESTAFNRDTFYHAAWSALQSITVHGIHCIQSGCFGPCCIKSTAFNHAAWNPLHSTMLNKIPCIKYSSISSRCMAQIIPIECSGFHALWLNAVNSMQPCKMNPDWMQLIPCSVIKYSRFHTA